MTTIPHQYPVADPDNLSDDARAFLTALESFGTEGTTPFVRRARIEQRLPAPFETEQVWAACWELLMAGVVESMKYQGGVYYRLLADPVDRWAARAHIAAHGEPHVITDQVVH